MKIEFIEITEEKHGEFTVLVTLIDDSFYMCESDMLEPEDYRFYRGISNLSHYQSVLKEIAYRCAKTQEELTIEYSEIEHANPYEKADKYEKLGKYELQHTREIK